MRRYPGGMTSTSSDDGPARALALPPARLRSAQTAAAAAILFFALSGPFWRTAFGWQIWAVLAVLIATATIVWTIRWRARLRLRWVSRTLLLFALVATASLAWSAVPTATLLGIGLLWVTIAAALPLATLLSWPQFAAALDHATRWLLGLSLLFELVVAGLIRHPLVSGLAQVEWQDATGLQLWSRNLLFAGGPIQGLLGNSILLGVVAAIAVITVSIRLADGALPRGKGAAWLGLALLMLGLTRSATVLAALAVVGAVAVLAILHRRLGSPAARAALWSGVLLLAAGAVTAAVLLRDALLALIGKSPDLTGRFEIWQTVAELAAERPIGGIGWLGAWPAWTPPFDTLVVRWDVVQLQAHNAWLDLWLQLGAIGVVAFLLVVVIDLVRAWSTAAEPVRTGAGLQPWRAVSLLPLLLLTFLVVQTAAESAILYESGLLLFATLTLRLSARPLERDDQPR